MLSITIPGGELWDETTQEFVYFKDTTIQLEHSLISISKWEAKWHKAFLGKADKTPEELLDYIKCMTITQNVSPDAYNHLTEDNIKSINAYIDNPMTATYIREKPSEGGKGKAPKETITSELIYYWMIANNIPVEFQRWHLNRLLTLIRVCGVKNNPKKMSKRDILRENKSMNAQRRAKLGTRG